MATPVQIDEQMDARIQRLASLRKRSPESIVCEAIAQYVAREEDRASFIGEAEASWKSYQETGLHLNAREAQDWLAKWGTDGDEAAPKCHE
ncbi:MAG: CopG family transcriptional regulator [Oxalobacteraceae bacterium]|nr:MAG: CopG family transcriptional regulator [Oxalobacteraceae bacterium]